MSNQALKGSKKAGGMQAIYYLIHARQEIGQTSQESNHDIPLEGDLENETALDIVKATVNALGYLSRNRKNRRTAFLPDEKGSSHDRKRILWDRRYFPLFRRLVLLCDRQYQMSDKELYQALVCIAEYCNEPGIV